MNDRSSPRKVEEYIKTEYWACNVLGHRHKTQHSAASCMERRKGEAGELKKLKRNLSMIHGIVHEKQPFSAVSKAHFCSEPNVIKAVNSSLSKAWRFAKKNGGVPYPARTWKRTDLVNPELKKELDFLIEILKEKEVVLTKLVNS